MSCMMLRERFSNRKIFVDILALFFGIGSWIGINGIYVQLPLLVNTAPEGWNLPSYIVMVVQFANLGPILYTLYAKFAPYTRDNYIISGLLISGSLSIFILAFTYDKTTIIFGERYSTVFLGLMVISSFVGCTSSVLFMPYMRNYREIYLVSYLVGEGLSGFVPSLVALIQGVGGNGQCVQENGEWITKYPPPKFSVSAFFIFIATILGLSFLAFICLTKLRVAKGERVRLPSSTETLPTDTNAPPSYKTTSGWTMPKQTYLSLLGMMGLVCFLGNGILPSIQSFTCLPYGNVAYHLTVTLSSMAGPLAMCLGFVVKAPKVNLLFVLMTAVVILSGVLGYLALLSPKPPLQNSWVGTFVVVILWILVCGISGFVKMGITTLFRPDPGRGMYYTGVATQIGSLTAAIIAFYLVNKVKLFEKYDPCKTF